MSELQATVNELNQFKAELDKEMARHEAAKKDCKQKIAACEARLALCGAGLNMALVELAKTVIYVNGDYKTGDRKKAVNDAMKWLSADGGKKLVKEYIGIKNYSGFGDQREDHKYGYGPRHGSIVFSIGRRVRDRDLTSEEIEAALYYLLNIEQIQKAQTAAA